MKNLTEEIKKAVDNLKGVIKETPLQFNERLSKLYDAKIYIKREDLQPVRSYKIRGAYNKIVSLTDKERRAYVVTASAGNHAQGVAFACAKLKIRGVIFMPTVTPTQKIERVKYFGDGYIQINLVGQTYDESSQAAKKFAQNTAGVYISAFDDEKVIAGQGTIGKEIYEQLQGKIDYLLVPAGGGGLIAGVGGYLKEKNKKIKIFCVESKGADCMFQSLKKGKISSLSSVDTFCDGIAVKTPGKITFAICQKYVDEITVVVCILSGGNNDLLRYPEVLEKSLVYQGKKHYFLIEFAQKEKRGRRLLELN